MSFIRDTSPDLHSRLLELKMEPWRTVDNHNGGVKAHNGGVKAHNGAVEGLYSRQWQQICATLTRSRIRIRIHIKVKRGI
jgi:hypothetical protein